MSEIDQLSAPCQQIVQTIRSAGYVTTHELMLQLEMSQQSLSSYLIKLENKGWVNKRKRSTDQQLSGRPRWEYSLTDSGDHLLPKRYDELSLELILAIKTALGPEALSTVLEHLSTANLQKLLSKISNLSLADVINGHGGICQENSSQFYQVNETAGLAFVETNCPFPKVAESHPELCECAIRSMEKVLGCEIEREQSYQSGDTCCMFLVQENDKNSTVN